MNFYMTVKKLQAQCFYSHFQDQDMSFAIKRPNNPYVIPLNVDKGSIKLLFIVYFIKPYPKCSIFNEYLPRNIFSFI